MIQQKQWPRRTISFINVSKPDFWFCNTRFLKRKTDMTMTEAEQEEGRHRDARTQN